MTQQEKNQILRDLGQVAIAADRVVTTWVTAEEARATSDQLVERLIAPLTELRENLDAYNAAHGESDPAPPPVERQAIIVTVEGKPARRYVVVDEVAEFAEVPDGPCPVPEGTPALGPDGPGTATRAPGVSEIRQAREDHLGRFYFGCRKYLSPGKVDEMYRTLGTWEVVRVQRQPWIKVWGERS